MNRRLLLRVGSALAPFACGLHSARAQGWPERPVTLIVSAPAGTSPDIVGRLLAVRLAALWNQPVTVDNRPGAGGALAMNLAKSAPADGSTLILVNAGAVLVTPQLSKDAGYDPVNDFAQLGHVADTPMIIVGLPPTTKNALTQLLARAMADPGRVRIGSTEAATLPYLLGKRLAQFTGTRFIHRAFDKPAAALEALARGEIDYYIDGVGPMLPLIKSERVATVAVTADRALPGLEKLPLVKDSVPGFVAIGWFALMGPKGLRPELAVLINHDLNQALSDAELRVKLREFGIYPTPRTPFESTLFLKSEIAKWSSVFRIVNVPRTP